MEEVEEGCEVAQCKKKRLPDCQPNCLTRREPPIVGASQSRVVTRAAGSAAGVSSRLPRRFADLTPRILPDSGSS